MWMFGSRTTVKKVRNSLTWFIRLYLSFSFGGATMQRASFPSLFRIVSWCVGYPFVLRGDSAVHPLSWIQLVSLCTFWIILAWDRQLQWQAKRPWRASPSHKQSINHTTTLLISFFCSEVEISCYIVDAFQVAFPRKLILSILLSSVILHNIEQPFWSLGKWSWRRVSSSLVV